MADAKLIVYVLDDDESVRASLKLLLEASGYRVVTFKSAEDLLGFDFEEDPCCLILDVGLPGMNGFRLHEHLVKVQIRIPVVFITGKDSHGMENEARRLGAVAYIRKPFDEQCLLDAIQLALKGHQNSGTKEVQGEGKVLK